MEVRTVGKIRAKIRLVNDSDLVLHEHGKLPKKKIRSADVDGVVDTGAVMMMLPQDLVDNLGLRSLGKTTATLANEEKIEMSVAGTVDITIAGRSWKTDCLVGPPGCEPLIGQLILERLDLITDCAKRTVTPRPESPYRPTLKLKALSYSQT